MPLTIKKRKRESTNKPSKFISCFLIILFYFIFPGRSYGFDLLSLSPGDQYQDIIKEIKKGNLKPIKHGPRGFVLNMPVFFRVFEQQRSLLEFDRQKKLVSVSVQIRPGPGAHGNDVLRLYNDVKDLLIKRLGMPSWEFKRGVARPEEILMSLSNGALKRSIQWEDKRNIRLGIPQRVDGNIIIEILVTKKLIPRNATFWGGKQF